MSDQTQDDNRGDLDPELKEVGFSFKRIIVSLIHLFKGTFNIRAGAQITDTIEGIRKDISFKGHNSWILVFSILIASIGLNVNSIPVIIGAMLISPLMGPILGLGLAVGTNDWETLTRSLKNFLVMVIIALTTSSLYFYLSPLEEITSELLSRVKPTLLDVFIAIFGGLAGIVAGSRKEKSNVVPGVAIATALMPPLCTAGYGLAHADSSIFFGAMYLFLLNSVFICISTYLVIRYLRFPLKEFVDRKGERRIKVSIWVFVSLVIIPSTFIFYDVIKETIFNKNAREFIAQEVYYEGAEIINQKVVFQPEEKKIELFLIGERVPSGTLEAWKKKLNTYDLADTKLTIHQSKDETGEIAGKLSEKVKSGIISDLYEKNAEILANKEQRIAFLENEISRLTRVDTIPVNALYKEARVLYPWVKNIQAGQLSGPKSVSTDKMNSVLVYCTLYPVSKVDSAKFSTWMDARLNSEEHQLIFLRGK